MFFDEVRITLYFDMFELHMEITLQLRFFARNCDVFLLRHNYVIYLFNIVTFFDNVRMTLYFCTFELRMEITLNYVSFFLVLVTYFLLRQNYVIYLLVVVTFFDKLELRYILVSSNYVLKLRYKMVIF